MIRLIDIILEDASGEAERMGLVRKPGFGLYGPPGDDKPATHKSMLGRLVQLRQDDKSTQSQQPAQQKQDTPAPVQQKTPQQPSVTQQKSVARSTSPIGRTRVYEVTGLSDIVSGVSSTFGEDGKVTNINETLNAVTRAFGRDVAPTPTIGGPTYDMLVEVHGEGIKDYVMGFYNRNTDSVEISPLMTQFLDTPISDWTDNQILAFKTYVHEVLHSTNRQRLELIASDAMSIAIEEGMTEYIAQGVALGAIESKNSRAQDANSGEGYRGYVDAMEFMVRYGELNVFDLFRNPDPNKIKEIVRRTQNKVVLNTLKEAGADEETVDRIFGAIQVAWQDKETILLTDEKFAQAMFQIRQQMEAGTPLSSEEIKELLKNYLR